MGVNPYGNPQRRSGPADIPAPLVPVSAEDFAARKRRRLLAWGSVAALVALLGIWLYRRTQAPVEAQQSFDIGQRLLKATRYPEAILSFDHALALKSDLTEAYRLRGRANAAENNFDSAIQDFTQVIQRQPGSAEAFIERAAARLGKKDYSGVIADCGEAISRDSKLAYAYNLRGMAFRETNNLQKSVEDFNRAVELSPAVDTYFQRAATYQLMGQHRLAIADLDRMIDLAPGSPMGYLARARSREALGDAAGASKDRETGRSLEGGDTSR